MEKHIPSKISVALSHQDDALALPVQQQPLSIKPKKPPREQSFLKSLPTVNCPPGLEYLSQIETIMIQQKGKLIEVCIWVEKNNRYEINDSHGQRIYLAVENNCFCTRIMLGYCRPFTMSIFDIKGQEVIILDRPLKCSLLCFHGCLQEIKICTPSGLLIGYVSQKRHTFLRKFLIQNEERKDILSIVGPTFWCGCCRNVVYQIKSPDEKVVLGKISKLWCGLLREIFTDFSDYDVQFPSGIDVNTKALVIGACFLIIMEFSELQSTIEWLGTPGSGTSCHPALEYFSQINQLLVSERFDLLQANSYFANSKTYEIKNNRGQRLFFAEEKCNCLLRHLCGPQRPLSLTIYDNAGKDVIKMHKTLGYSCCWTNCYLKKLKVVIPPGETIGYVYQLFHPFLPKFIIKNKDNEAIMTIKGPWMVSRCFKYITFHILSPDDNKVIGKISNQWTKFIEGLDTSNYHFQILFPFDLDANIKALILGASFLIDCMYFEL